MVCGFGPMGMVPLGYEFCTSKDSNENKVNKFEEKVKNKAKHGIATAAVAGTSIAGAALVLGHEEKKAIKDGVKFSTQKMNSVLNQTPQKTAEFIKKVKAGDFKDIKIATQQTQEKAAKFLNNQTGKLKEGAQNITKQTNSVLTKAKQGSSTFYKIMKKSLTFGSEKLGAMFDTIANSFKTMPKNQKIAIGILTAGLTAIGLINNHSSYKNGKIDQKYEQ